MSRYSIAAIVRVVFRDVHYLEHQWLKDMFVSAGFSKEIKFFVNTENEFYYSLTAIDKNGRQIAEGTKSHCYLGLLVTIVGEQEDATGGAMMRSNFKKFMEKIGERFNGTEASVLVLDIRRKEE